MIYCDQFAGSLYVPSGIVELKPGTRVTRSVVLLCCNLITDGEVDGNILIFAGNVTLGPTAHIKGLVRVICLMPVVMLAILLAAFITLTRRRSSTRAEPDSIKK